MCWYGFYWQCNILVFNQLILMTCAAVIVDNRPGIEPIIQAHEKYLPKDWDMLWVKNEQTNSAHEYNKLLTSKRFWRNMPDKVLIFQHDSMLLREGIEEFLEWDFIGAPIKHIPGCMNGGLSLRDSKAMLKVINHLPYSPRLGNCDIYFVNALRQFNGRLPNKETAQKFSVETEFHLGSVGYHAIDSYLTPTECKLIREQYKNWKL